MYENVVDTNSPMYELPVLSNLIVSQLAKSSKNQTTPYICQPQTRLVNGLCDFKAELPYYLGPQGSNRECVTDLLNSVLYEDYNETYKHRITNEIELETPFRTYVLDPVNIILDKLQHKLSIKYEYEYLSGGARPDYILHNTIDNHATVVFEFKVSIKLLSVYLQRANRQYKSLNSTQYCELETGILQYLQATPRQQLNLCPKLRAACIQTARYMTIAGTRYGIVGSYSCFWIVDIRLYPKAQTHWNIHPATNIPTVLADVYGPYFGRDVLSALVLFACDDPRTNPQYQHDIEIMNNAWTEALDPTNPNYNQTIETIQRSVASQRTTFPTFKYQDIQYAVQLQIPAETPTTTPISTAMMETESVSSADLSPIKAAKPTITYELLDMNAVKVLGYTDSMLEEYIELLSYDEPVKCTLYGTYVINQQTRHVMYKIFNEWAQHQANTELNTLLLIQQYSNDDAPKQCDVKLLSQLIAAKSQTEQLTTPTSTSAQTELIQRLFARCTVVVTEYIEGAPCDHSTLAHLTDTQKGSIRAELSELIAQLTEWKLFYTDINENNILIDSTHHAHLIDYDHVLHNVSGYGYETIQLNRIWLHAHQEVDCDQVVYGEVRPDTAQLLRNTVYQDLQLHGESTEKINELYAMMP